MASYPETTIVAGATGRGTYQRVNPDKYGFPRTYKMHVKQVFGFATGDLVRAAVPKGKRAGVHVGRVAVRFRGSFNIRTAHGLVTDLNHRHCVLIQRGDGWSWSRQLERRLDAA